MLSRQATSGMAKTGPKNKARLAPLAAGQTWRMAGLNLEVTNVGPLMVQYKLFKPKALKGSSEIQSKTNVEKYLKKNKAVLQRA
jgi:hypothetical protein